MCSGMDCFQFQDCQVNYCMALYGSVRHNIMVIQGKGIMVLETRQYHYNFSYQFPFVYLLSLQLVQFRGKIVPWASWQMQDQPSFLLSSQEYFSSLYEKVVWPTSFNYRLFLWGNMLLCIEGIIMSLNSKSTQESCIRLWGELLTFEVRLICRMQFGEWNIRFLEFIVAVLFNLVLFGRIPFLLMRG